MYWTRLCHAIGREDLENDPRFASNKAKSENREALFDILDAAFRSKTLEEWRVRLTEVSIPWAPVQTLHELIVDPQARANDFFIPVDHPKYGRMEVVANPVSLSKASEKIRMPAADLGQHTDEVLLKHGYTQQDIERFRKDGVIG
jgi:crotonobetainyl-CoA:carnitine CoA-transferase CaiB-like acyl-CoA transferase